MLLRCFFGVAAVLGIVTALFVLTTTIHTTSSQLVLQNDLTLADTEDLNSHEARVNSFTASTQSNASVAFSKNNESVVVWDSRRQQKGTYGIYLQRYAKDGTAIGQETQVNLFTTSMQMRPAVSTDGLGGTWVAWDSFGQDGSMQSVIARRFDADGFHGGDEILVNQTTEGNQSNVVVAADSAGNATMVWTESAKIGAPLQLVARRFDRQGKPLTDEFAISTNLRNQNIPTVAMDGQQRLIVVWAETDTKGSPSGIHGRIFDQHGEAVTEAVPITSDPSQLHIEPSVAAAADGTFVVSWLTAHDEEYAVFVKSFDQLAQPIGDAQRVSNEEAKNVSGAAVAASGNGQFVVAWNQEVDGSFGKNVNVQAQLFAADGNRLGSIFQVNLHQDGRHRLTGASGKQRVAWGSDNRLAFAWNGKSTNDESSANLTVMIHGDNRFSLSDPSDTALAGNSFESVSTARPHDPPVFDPKKRSRLPNGGDPTPGPLTGEFGFIGITSTGWTPPDPEMAVGPNQIVAITNGEISFFDKDGTKTFSDEIEDSFGFWGNQGATGFVFDPEVLFDPHSNRFFAMACERSGSSSFFLLAVSDDDNPNGTWFNYRFNVTGIAESDIDSPNMGIDEEAVYLTADFFGPDEFLVFILRKSDLLAGLQPLTRNLSVIGSQSYGIPTMYDADSPAFYMIQAFEFGNFSTVRMHAITDSLGTPTRVTANVSVPSYGHPVDPPQMGTSARPELFEARFWDCMYRNGSLWAVHHQSPNSSGTARARWYEFDMNGWPTSGNQPLLVQSGDIFPGGNVRTFFPSIWVDALGNAAITCARSNSNEFISMSRALRQAGDPLGEFGPIEFVRESTAASTTGRWGDYSKTMSDPSAPGTFWGIHEYNLPGNNWNTWIGQYVVDVVLVEIPAESLNVLRGLQEGGGVAELANSDDAYLQVRAGLTLNPSEPPVWIEVEATSPNDTPANLTFTLEARANTGNLNQAVELFNFDTDSYEEVDSRNATTSDTSVEIQPGGKATRFIEPGTGLLRARIGWRSQGIIAQFPWIINVDQTVWTVTE